MNEIKTNKIVNKFLLAGDKFKPGMHLRLSGFTDSAFGPFTKNKERKQKFNETGDSRYIHQNQLDKACFQHDMTYGDFRDLPRRTGSDKVLHDKAFNVAKNLKCDRYQRGLALTAYKCFDKKTSDGAVKSEMVQNKELAEELHKSIIRKSETRKVYSSFKDNIWGADLADMQLISKLNKIFQFSLCVIDIYSKNAWVASLKDKKGIAITKAFQETLDESDNGSEFYKRSMKS